MFILKRKIFDEAIKLACEAFNLSEGQLYHSRTMNAVEARYCVLWALSAYLSDQELATMFGKTRQAINHLKNNRGLDTPHEPIRHKANYKQTASKQHLWRAVE